MLNSLTGLKDIETVYCQECGEELGADCVYCGNCELDLQNNEWGFYE
jgi:hypothetical protein